MLLIDLTWTIQADRERALRDASRRREARAAASEQSQALAGREPGHDVSSDQLGRVALRDGAGRRGDAGADVGGFQDLHPASRS